MFTFVPVVGFSFAFTPFCSEYARPLSDIEIHAVIMPHPLITWMIAWVGMTHSFIVHTIPIPSVVEVINGNRQAKAFRVSTLFHLIPLSTQVTVKIKRSGTDRLRVAQMAEQTQELRTEMPSIIPNSTDVSRIFSHGSAPAELRAGYRNAVGNYADPHSSTGFAFLRLG